MVLSWSGDMPAVESREEAMVPDVVVSFLPKDARISAVLANVGAARS